MAVPVEISAAATVASVRPLQLDCFEAFAVFAPGSAPASATLFAVSVPLSILADPAVPLSLGVPSLDFVASFAVVSVRCWHRGSAAGAEIAAFAPESCSRAEPSFAGSAHHPYSLYSSAEPAVAFEPVVVAKFAAFALGSFELAPAEKSAA